jgi:imidazolonepropionase-like amidohydrolase
MMEGELGCIRAGAYADLIVVDGDPLEDLSLLAADGAHVPLVMRAGEIVKSTLGSAA